MAVADLSETTQRVMQQYEEFPYPLRNPSDERTRLHITSLDDLPSINYYCFQGRKSFQGARLLVAGGGTGDAVTYLAHQLRDLAATIVYLDLSPKSLEIARSRLACLGAEHRVTWLCGSLLDLPRMGLEPFDYINCSGVLHHLDEPAAGLHALCNVLKEDGALGLMLYGQYGRMAVYQLQELMRLVNQGASDPHSMVDNTRTVLATLPESNWFRRGANLFTPRLEASDAELYDMFLHSCDRAYTVPQLFELLDSAKLNFVEHTLDQRALYQPGLVIRDPGIRCLVERLSEREQQAASELYWGAITKHCFWTTPRPRQPIDLLDPDNIPFFSRFAAIHHVRDSILANDGQELWTLNIKHHADIEVTLRFPVVPAVRRFIELVDDQRPMGEIVELISNDYTQRPEPCEVWAACMHVMKVLLNHDLLLLRHKSVPQVYLGS